MMDYCHVESKVRNEAGLKYPRLKKYELMEAIKLNFISYADSVKLIRNPNEYSIFQEIIDFE